MTLRKMVHGKDRLRSVVCGFFLLSFFSAVQAESLVARNVYSGNQPRDSIPNEVGFRFKTGDTPRSIEALGFIDLDNTNPDIAPDGDGLISSVTVSLWVETNQTLVAQATVPSGLSGILLDGFRYAAIASGPVTLAANADYVLSFNADAVVDWWLDRGDGVILNSYFVGLNSSSTWEVRWGDSGVMPPNTGGWGLGQTYGCVNMVSSLAASNSNQITINPSNHGQVFEGFGEGTMDQFVPYWYSVYPTANLESYLDQLYTLDDLGLGFNICRVLMPVGDAPGHAHHDRMWLIGNVAPKSFEPEEDVFDWTGHENILWRHQGAAQRGAIMWANWYSMPYWLTISGCTSGAGDGLQNLIAGKEARFAEHACDVLDHYKNNWGIDFDYVSLLNECEATWWQEYGGQPGCHIPSAQAITLIQELDDCLTAHGHNAKQIAYDAAYANVWWYLDHLLGSTIEPLVDVISFHQYTTSAFGIEAWKSRALSYSKSLWQTEWGDWENAGYPNDLPHQQALNHAAKISEALNDFSCTAWVLWEPDFIFDIGAGGFHPREAYWVTAQYSRHIRPGMQRIESSDTHPNCKTTTWLDPSGRQLVLVSYNAGSEVVTIDYDFSPYQVVRIKEIRQTSESQDYENAPFTQPSGNTYSLTAPAESVTTLIAGVDDLYLAWEIDHGLTNGPMDDHDVDGLINLYEYGLNGNPTNGFVDADLPMFGPDAGGLQYVYTQRNNDTNLMYYLKLATNIVSPVWTNLGYTVTGTNVTGGVFDYVTNLINTTAPEKFIKLEIEQSP